jgi:hypothetical protein
MQSLDLLGLQRDRCIAPTETDVRMMAFSFREFTNRLDKGKCLPEITKPEAPFDAVSFLQQLPVWGLSLSISGGRDRRLYPLVQERGGPAPNAASGTRRRRFRVGGGDGAGAWRAQLRGHRAMIAEFRH